MESQSSFTLVVHRFLRPSGESVGIGVAFAVGPLQLLGCWDRWLEEVAKATGGGYCWPRMIEAGIYRQETVSGHRLGALGRGYPPPLPMHPWAVIRTQCYG